MAKPATPPTVPFIERPVHPVYVADHRGAHYGSCATFCIEDAPTRGATVDEHGLLCNSGMLLRVDGHDANGIPAELYAAVVAPYFHGVYAADHNRPNPFDARRVQLTVLADGVEPDPDDEGRSLYFDAGDVRRIAAALIRAADVIDELDKPFNSALARRESDLGGRG